MTTATKQFKIAMKVSNGWYPMPRIFNSFEDANKELLIKSGILINGQPLTTYKVVEIGE